MTINAMLPKESVWLNLQNILDRSAAAARQRSTLLPNRLFDLARSERSTTASASASA